jgi:hypothetical protein
MSLPVVYGAKAAGGAANEPVANTSAATIATSKDVIDFVLIILPP